MKRVLLLLSFVIMTVACQKDYYLADLTAAQSKVSSLEQRVSSLHTENSSLYSEVSELNSDLSELRNDLESAQDLNDYLSDRITTLEDEVVLLEETINEQEFAIQELNGLASYLEDELNEANCDRQYVYTAFHFEANDYYNDGNIVYNFPNERQLYFSHIELDVEYNGDLYNQAFFGNENFSLVFTYTTSHQLYHVYVNGVNIFVNDYDSKCDFWKTYDNLFR